MTEAQKRGRVSLLFAFVAILTFMAAMAWLRYRHQLNYWIPVIGLLSLTVMCWQVWRGWIVSYVMLCVASGLGALISFLVARNTDLAVFAVGMNGFAFVNLMLPVTRAFLEEQRKIRSRERTSGI